MSSTLLYQLDTIEEIATGFADPVFFAEVIELREKLRIGRINLVVLGLFKRGKSSLVNALLGCSLAPVGVTPLTAIVTSFEHDPDKSHARVLFRDGHHVDIAVAGITQFVSEEENPNNEKQVSVVRLFDRVLPILKTMTLIDTPGLGSAYAHNTATTLDFVPRIDAALFVLSADLPISQGDIEFLKTLKDTVSTILFVLNKKDLLEEHDLRKLIAHNQKMITTQVGLPAEAVDIIPVSAQYYQQGRFSASNLDALHQQIRKVMAGGNQSLLREAIARRTNRLCKRLELLLRSRLEALQLPLEDLQNRQRQLLRIPARLESRKDDFEQTVKGQTTRLQEQVRQIMQQRADSLRKELPHKITLASEDFPGNPSYQGNQVSEWILRTLEQERSDLETLVKSRFNTVLQQYAEQPDGFLAEVVRQFSQVLGVDFSAIVDKFDLDVYSPFYLSLDAGILPSFQGPFLHHFLSRSVRQDRFQRRLLNYYEEIIVRNTAAVIYNLEYRIQESLRKFNSDLRQRLHDLVNNLQTLLNETVRLHAERTVTLDEALGDVREKLQKLETIQQTNNPLTQIT